MSIKGLNLGGQDKDPTTPPSGPAEPTDAQEDADGIIETPKTNGEVADATVEQAEALAAEPAARWSSHPIMRYTVGDFHFENGLLVLLTEKEAAEFKAVYEQLPIYEQSRIKPIDISAAEALVRERIASQGGATKGIDSSTGERAPNKAVGTGSLTGE